MPSWVGWRSSHMAIERTTNDVDVLLTAEGFEEFCKRFVPEVLRASHEGRPAASPIRRTRCRIDILVDGPTPAAASPARSLSRPGRRQRVIEKKRVVNLPTLIQLKLAARRYQDFADVVNLIRVHNLDESFQDKLHPSLHRDYIECLEEKRREDEYEALP